MDQNIDVSEAELRAIIDSVKRMAHVKSLWHQLEDAERSIPPLTASQDRIAPSQ